MHPTSSCSPLALLQRTDKLEPSYAAYACRRRLLDSRSRAELVEIARRADAVGARTSARALLADLLVRELRSASATYRPGDVTRRILAPLGINVDARVSEYRSLIAKLLPGLASLPNETTIRHQIAKRVPALDLSQIAADCAVAVLAGRDLAEARRDLQLAVETAAHRCRDDELDWLENELAPPAWTALRLGPPSTHKPADAEWADGETFSSALDGPPRRRPVRPSASIVAREAPIA